MPVAPSRDESSKRRLENDRRKQQNHHEDWHWCAVHIPTLPLETTKIKIAPTLECDYTCWSMDWDRRPKRRIYSTSRPSRNGSGFQRAPNASQAESHEV